MYDVKTVTQLWIAAFWTMLICNSCWTSIAVVWLLHRQFRAILRGDRDINAPQPAEMRHSDAIKFFNLRRVEQKEGARPKAGYLTASLSVFLLAFLVGACWLLTNTYLR